MQKVSLVKGILYSLSLISPIIWYIMALIDGDASQAIEMFGYNKSFLAFTEIGWLTLVICFVNSYGIFGTFDFSSNIGKLGMIILCILSVIFYDTYAILIALIAGGILGYVITKVNILFTDWDLLPKVINALSCVVGFICIIAGGGLMYFLYIEKAIVNADNLSEIIVATILAISYLATGIACFMTMITASEQEEIIEEAKNSFLNYWNPIYWLMRSLY